MQGTYSVDESTKTAQNKSTWIQPGIHEDLKLVDVKYETTKNGNEYLAFYVENEHGDKVGNTEWPVKFSIPFEQMDAEKKKVFVDILENQKSKIKQIVEVFFTEEQLKAKPYIFQVNSFKEFAEKTIEFLGEAFKDQTIRLKVVFDKKGYTTFGQNAGHVFIENMSIAKEDSKIRIQPSDKMERPAVKDTEHNEQPPLELVEESTVNTTAPAASTDDLPF